MSKAYNKIELEWLDKMMRKLGIHGRWRNLIMQCISFVNYIVKFNRSSHGCTVAKLRCTVIGELLCPS